MGYSVSGNRASMGDKWWKEAGDKMCGFKDMVEVCLHWVMCFEDHITAECENKYLCESWSKMLEIYKSPRSSISLLSK